METLIIAIDNSTTKNAYEGIDDQGDTKGPKKCIGKIIYSIWKAKETKLWQNHLVSITLKK